MFKSLSTKNPVSASDPRQGASFHRVLANFVLKGVLEHRFLLYGIDDDEVEKLMKSKGLSDRAYKDEAAVYRRDINDKLASFDKFIGRLEYNYADSLKAQFAVTDEEATAADDTATGRCLSRPPSPRHNAKNRGAR